MPGIFDQEITAAPCRAGCVRHVHAAHLPSAPYGPDQNDIGGNVPTGWTPQPRPFSASRDESLLWFQCNMCDALVSELEVEGHRCG